MSAALHRRVALLEEARPTTGVCPEAATVETMAAELGMTPEEAMAKFKTEARLAYECVMTATDREVGDSSHDDGQTPADRYRLALGAPVRR